MNPSLPENILIYGDSRSPGLPISRASYRDASYRDLANRVYKYRSKNTTPILGFSIKY